MIHSSIIRKAQNRYNKYRAFLDWPVHNFLTSKRTYALAKSAQQFAKNFNNVKVHFYYCSEHKEFESQINVFAPGIEKRIFTLHMYEFESYTFSSTTYGPFLKEGIGLQIWEGEKTIKGIDKSVSIVRKLIKKSNLDETQIFS